MFRDLARRWGFRTASVALVLFGSALPLFVAMKWHD
jgi:hypothetical protein